MNMDKIKGSELHDQVMGQLDKSKIEEKNKAPHSFTVFKNGVKKTITIDLHKNQELVRKVQKMNMSKSCADIFKNVVI